MSNTRMVLAELLLASKARVAEVEELLAQQNLAVHANDELLAAKAGVVELEVLLAQESAAAN